MTIVNSTCTLFIWLIIQVWSERVLGFMCLLASVLCSECFQQGGIKMIKTVNRAMASLTILSPNSRSNLSLLN